MTPLPPSENESSASPHSRIDGVLLGYQRRWLADTAEVKVCEKSRRIGLTWAEAAEAVLAAARRRSPWDTYYISYNREMTREFIDTCADWTLRFGEAASEVEEVVIENEGEDINAFRITFPTRAKILALPSRPTSLRGMQGRVVIDEAAFVPDLSELLKAAMALLIWGAQVIVVSTHNGIDNPFNELVSEVRAGKAPHSLHRIDIEDALADGLYRRILERRSAVTGAAEAWTADGERQWLEDLVARYGEGAQEELYCVPSQGSAKYFPRALIERAMSGGIPVVTYERDSEWTYRPEAERQADCAEWIAENLAPALAAARARAAKEPVRSYLGGDVGRSVDLSVFALFLETAKLDLEAAVYVEMRNVPFHQQHQVFCALVDGAPRFSAAALDARGNGQMLAEMAAQKYGPAYVHEVMISRKTYEQYMPRYRARFEDRTIRVPRHAGVLDDHRVVVLDRGVPVIAERTGEGGKQRHGDSAVAGMLAEYAVRNDDSTYQPYSVTPVRVTGSARWLGRDEDDEDGDEGER